MYPIRTEAEHQSLVERHRLLQTKKSKEELCTEFSFHPILGGLCGWPDASHPSGYGSSSLHFNFEPMHNEDLGVFLYLVNAIEVSAMSRGSLLPLALPQPFALAIAYHHDVFVGEAE